MPDKKYDLKDYDLNNVHKLDNDQLIFLALQYQFGAKGYGKDIELAERLNNLAVEKGDSRGLTNLGLLHSSRDNSLEAIRYFTKAANAGESWARYNLGIMSLAGMCVERSYTKAVQHFSIASNQGNFMASYALAQTCINRYGDPSHGLTFLERSLNQMPGFLPSLFAYARAMLKKDASLSFQILRKCAEKGCPESSYLLATQCKDLTESEKEAYLKTAIDHKSVAYMFDTKEKEYIKAVQDLDYEKINPPFAELFSLSFTSTPEYALRLARLLKDNPDFPLAKTNIERLYDIAFGKGSVTAAKELLEIYKKEHGTESEQTFKLLRIGGYEYKIVDFLKELAELYKSGLKKDSVLYDKVMKDIEFAELPPEAKLEKIKN